MGPKIVVVLLLQSPDDGSASMYYYARAMAGFSMHYLKVGALCFSLQYGTAHSQTGQW